MAKKTKTLIIGIAGGLLGFAFYKLLNQAVSDLFALFGIENFYAVQIILIATIVALLWLIGKKTKILDSIL